MPKKGHRWITQLTNSQLCMLRCWNAKWFCGVGMVFRIAKCTYVPTTRSQKVYQYLQSCTPLSFTSPATVQSPHCHSLPSLHSLNITPSLLRVISPLLCSRLITVVPPTPTVPALYFSLVTVVPSRPAVPSLYFSDYYAGEPPNPVRHTVVLVLRYEISG